MTAAALLGTVVHADVAAFRYVNSVLYFRPAADVTFFLANDYLILALLALALLLYAWSNGWKSTAALAVWGAAAVVLSNLLHNYWLKPFFDRPRPFLALPEVHLSANLQNLSAVSLSFPSTHAASAVALGIVAASLDPRLRWPAVLFMLAVGFGSVYSGGHYPLDVLAGYGVGGVLGWFLRQGIRRLGPGVSERGRSGESVP